ncbi:hypothetical protein PGIGA_G00202680 [Pangasianodon gigas]|uniref:Uncharacterized protein n=1 Tax=Pangasianodon gigas TaxID=30993 RepID=A0ACC5WG86_PANGG|nr:hypothetical protein [Pangasianodon gigas]
MAGDLPPEQELVEDVEDNKLTDGIVVHLPSVEGTETAALTGSGNEESTMEPVVLENDPQVQGDEAEAEEEQLEKALQGLVTLDEIVEEDEDYAGPFNPETLVTLDEARGDEETDESEQVKINPTALKLMHQPSPRCLWNHLS